MTVMLSICYTSLLVSNPFISQNLRSLNKDGSVHDVADHVLGALVRHGPASSRPWICVFSLEMIQLLAGPTKPIEAGQTIMIIGPQTHVLPKSRMRAFESLLKRIQTV